MKLITALLAATLTFAGQALAHSDEYLDTIVTPHGGQMRMAGIHHYELVVKAGAISVYLTDHADQPVATTGASGSATVLVGRNRSNIDLKPAGENRLSGKGEFVMDASMRVVLNIALPGQQPGQARFTPLAPRNIMPAAADHSHGNDDHHHH